MKGVARCPGPSQQGGLRLYRFGNPGAGEQHGERGTKEKGKHLEVHHIRHEKQVRCDRPTLTDEVAALKEVPEAEALYVASAAPEDTEAGLAKP
jgi:hypothetical protein